MNDIELIELIVKKIAEMKIKIDDLYEHMMEIRYSAELYLARKKEFKE